MDLSIAITWQDSVFYPRAQQIAEALSLPLLNRVSPSQVEDYELALVVDDRGTGLQLTGPKQPNPLYVDFVEGAVGHRRKFGGGKGQSIAKAVGLGERTDLRVLDATAGLGRDAFVLATLGCDVTLLERSPVVALLLADGLERASTNLEVATIVERMHLVSIGAGNYMENLPEEDKPDIVYLDPMFPERGKSAKVKKDMQLFHRLVGMDLDADALLEPALSIAEYRVVVKRPAKAPYLVDKKPTYELKGKSNRFDVYVNRSLKQS